MIETNERNAPLRERHCKNEEKKEKRLSVVSLRPMGDSVESNGYSKVTTDIRTVPKIVVRSESARSLPTPKKNLLRTDSRRLADLNANLPNLHKTHKKVLRSPSYIVDASDTFLDPVFYNGYLERIVTEDSISERLCNQLDNLKDLIRDKAVNSLSASERAVYWFFNKLKYLSTRWYTHVILILVLFVYSAFGAVIFMLLEGYKEHDICTGLKATKTFSIKELFGMLLGYVFFCVCRTIPLVCYLCLGLSYVVCQTVCCFVFCS